jgi:hypothetical protein
MQFQVDLDGSFAEALKGVEREIIDAANDAVVKTTDELKALGKQTVGSALGSKVGNTVTTRKYNYVDPDVGLGQVAGWFYSRWWRKAAGGKVLGSANSADVRAQKTPLAANDILFGHTQDLTIKAVKGPYLLIPLIARRLLKRNPVDFRQPGVQMIPVNRHQGGKYTFSGPGVLVVQGGGVRGGARKRNKGLPVALLRQSVFVRKHLDMGPVDAFAEQRLAERIVLALAERGLNYPTPDDRAMAASLREKALAAALAALRTLGVPFTTRTINYRVKVDALPALIQYDGPETAEKIDNATLHVRTEFTVLALFRAPDAESLGPTADEWVAKVREALGADPQLGLGAEGVSELQYLGCGQPEPLTEDGSGPFGGIPVHFAIERYESPASPFSPVG